MDMSWLWLGSKGVALMRKEAQIGDMMGRRNEAQVLDIALT